MRIYHVPCLQDNYAWILHDIDTDAVGIVDPPVGEPVIDFLRNKNIQFKSLKILNTHFHRDHTGGNEYFKRNLGGIEVEIVGPSNERIPFIDRKVIENDSVMIGNYACRVLDIPGHTRGHIGYVFYDLELAFLGDTVFNTGCGGVMDKCTPSMMWHSLSKIMSLPKSTLIFCAHEYTVRNIQFALSLRPDNDALLAIFDEARCLRSKNEPTVPSMLEQELLTNPFFICSQMSSQQERDAASAEEAFAETRKQKDLWNAAN
jgi:hydroxyacylglutathione hydrolase